MSNSITSSTQVNSSYLQQQQQAQKQPPKSKQPEAQDTVQLSTQAKASSDTDHDGH